MVKKGYIYKICIKDGSIKDCYIGSTMCIKQRRHQHKSACNTEGTKKYNYPIYKFIREHDGWDAWELIILKKVKFEEKFELHKKERKYIEKYGSGLNRTVPTRTKKEYKDENKEKIKAKEKEYREDNAEKIAEYHKEYRENNAEKLKAKQKEYREDNAEKIKQHKAIKVECDNCDKVITKDHMSRHLRTKYCMEY